MKSTVKRWCRHYGYTWYGPGVYSSKRYDYKIHFAKGLFAIFRSAHTSELAPQSFTTSSGKQFLMFPVYSQLVGQKEMTESKFTHVTAWVKACLAGTVSEYSDAEAQQGAAPDAFVADEL